jgi:hypothetical protein
MSTKCNRRTSNNKKCKNITTDNKCCHLHKHQRGGSNLECTDDINTKSLCKLVEKDLKLFNTNIEKLNKRLTEIKQENYIVDRQVSVLFDILEDKHILTKSEMKDINFVKKLITSLNL